MARVTTGWTCPSGGAALEPRDVELPPLGETQVEVEIHYCGVCASDVTCCSGIGGPRYQFPLVAGHEGVGVCTAVGPGVTTVKVGDRVGVGILRFACGSCRYCCRGEDNLCSQRTLTFSLGHSGAFAHHVRLEAKYALPVPDGYPLELAGPLMCAGCTVFEPMQQYQLGMNHAVGVVGIGGLGHLALQFAAARGCSVYALSGSPDKEEEARRFGAHHFVNTKDEAALAAAAGKLDFVLVTAGLDTAGYAAMLGLLGIRGRLIIIGFSLSKIEATSMALITSSKGIVGSAGSSNGNARTMLQFAAKYNIKPQCEQFPVSEVNDVYERVKNNKLRYRAVLKFPAAL
eukprot:TRINITY_DN9643_c0_g1_i1.p1 TRINITY_DN9643_c0_g1~~TRINITY_DN9643_c0_g1_i1.p1  ORF type:complete len:344 (+),score=71.01 TRINITY_DN9643_c0_g1_i1:49-1080(+)